MRTYKASLLAAATLCCPSLALAQTAPDIEPDNGAEAAPREEAIVVVGKLTDSALDRDDIEITQANDLGDLFRRTPSVSVGGAIGIAEKIYVRGLEDAQLNISIDGAQIQGTLFHHVGRVSVEPELLERVDIQTGAGEATSGFGAIGGANLFADEQHRGLVTLALADDHGAIHVKRVERLAHGFHGGGIGGLLVAPPNELRCRYGSGLGHTDHLKHENTIERIRRERIH